MRPLRLGTLTSGWPVLRWGQPVRWRTLGLAHPLSQGQRVRCGVSSTLGLYRLGVGGALHPRSRNNQHVSKCCRNVLGIRQKSALVENHWTYQITLFRVPVGAVDKNPPADAGTRVRSWSGKIPHATGNSAHAAVTELGPGAGGRGAAGPTRRACRSHAPPRASCSAAREASQGDTHARRPSRPPLVTAKREPEQNAN